MRRRGNWYTLENTAKLMPSMTNNLNTNVFRLACTLKEEVDANILQEALDEALIEFPIFLYTMKDGLFWHYLEKSNIKPKIELETTHPCASMKSELLFRLSYFHKRINLEVYHVLSDGNGSMEFLKYIVSLYIEKKYGISSSETLISSSDFEKFADDFKKFDKSSYKIKLQSLPKAYKLKFQFKNNTIPDFIEVHTDVSSVKREAKKYGVTITIYLTALLIESIIENARVKDLKRPIGIAIPVDLRNTFPSKTSRNFFYTLTVQYKYKEGENLEDIINCVKDQFTKIFSKENLQDVLNSFMVIQKIFIVRVIPNFLKDFILGYIAKMSKSVQTTVLSNLGQIKMPQEYEPFIESFTTLMNTDDIQLTMCSFKDEMSLSFSSHIISKEIERSFIKKLQNITDETVKIYSNMAGDKNDKM